jgi:hypothetical protein
LSQEPTLEQLFLAHYGPATARTPPDPTGPRAAGTPHGET